MRRAKLVLGPEEVMHILGLDEDIRIAGFVASMDPVRMHVLLDCHLFAEIPDGQEARLVGLNDRLCPGSVRPIGRFTP